MFDGEMITSFIPITLILIVTVTGQHSVCKSLQWVPAYRKQIYTVIINDMDCPTWNTRNSITKESTTYTSLVLPKGMPFAFLCGACFSSGSGDYIGDANLTAEINNGQSLTFVPVKRNKNTLRHKKDDFTVCLISYGITVPLTKGGQITCRLNRAQKTYAEKLSFSVQRSPRVQEEEEEEKQVTSNGVTRLQCPDDKSIRNNVHVWFSTEKKEDSPEAEIPFLVPSLHREIDFRPKVKEQHVACAVYDVKKPSVVHLRRYKVLTTAEEIQSDQWAMNNLEDNTPSSNSGTSKRGILIVAGLLVAGICLTSILVCASFGLCNCGRKRNDKPELQQENNRLSLLQSSAYDKKFDEP